MTVLFPFPVFLCASAPLRLRAKKNVGFFSRGVIPLKVKRDLRVRYAANLNLGLFQRHGIFGLFFDNSVKLYSVSGSC